MSVTVQPITIAGIGRSVQSTFTDTINRANGSLGSNWAVGLQNVPGAAPFQLPAVEIGVSTIDAGQCMKYSTITGAVVGTVYYVAVQPLVPLGLLNRGQFSEWFEITHSKPGGGNDIFAGITVLQSMGGIGTGDSDCSAYILQFDSSTGNCVVIRRNKSVQTGIGVNQAYANNQTWRLSATINASDVTLRVSKNGTVVDTIVDNSGSRITTGMPGHMGTSLNNAAANFASEWRNFACGPA